MNKKKLISLGNFLLRLPTGGILIPSNAAHFLFVLSSTLLGVNTESLVYKLKRNLISSKPFGSFADEKYRCTGMSFS
jgi:hypothetical protein